jgi:O-antigen biosynthesis protein
METVPQGSPARIARMTGDAAHPDTLPPGTTVWEHCLGTGVAPVPTYFEGYNATIREILRKPPGRILELGCSAGRLCEFIREKYPDTHHTGIEMNPEAAAIARTRLSKVIEARLEDIDFAAEGIAPGSIDTFIAGDVLEHLYDPWRALVRVRPLLAPGAQVVVSVPNVRNLMIVGQLNNEGTWRYTPAGLLDITHIRFFTLRDVFRLMEETGYQMVDMKSNLDGRYADLYNANRGKAPVTIQVGRVKLENLTEADLIEYCTLQFVALATPKPVAANDANAA